MTTSDLKYAFRLLKKSPWFTLLTVLVLAGGLAITLYSFVFLDTMVYRELPLPESESMVRLRANEDGLSLALRAGDLATMREDVATLTEIGVYRTSSAFLGEPDSLQSVRTTRAESNIFTFSRTEPLAGRGFRPEDNAAGAEAVAVIGYSIWQSVFLGAEDVVGRLVRIDDRPTRIIGIMPQGYAFPINTQMWMPLPDLELRPSADSESRLDAYARLRPGSSAASATTELTARLRRLEQQRGVPEQMAATAVVASFQDTQWGDLGPRVVGVLDGLSFAILLLVCVNVGNLLLARTNERIREISVRVALGAPRFRLVVQMMLENLIICVVGGGLAVYFAAELLAASNGFFDTLLGDNLPFWWNWTLDSTAAMAAGVLLLLTIVLVSVLPALSVMSISPNALLRDGTRGARGLATGRISRALLTVEVSLIALLMLVGSVVSMVAYRAANFDFGMDFTDVYSTSVQLSGERFDTPAEQLAYYEQVLENLRNDDSVDAAVILQELRPAGFAVDGRAYVSSEDYPTGRLIVLSASESPIGPPLIAGRGFDSRDSSTGLPTVIVNESLAHEYWPNGSAVGQRISVVTDDGTEQRTVVGVVGDVRYNPLASDSASLAALYVPLPQLVRPVSRFLVRHRGQMQQVGESMYRALGTIGPGLVAGRITSGADAIDQMTLFARMATNLFIACGAFAVLLAMTGVYGLSSNSVLQRMHEIGLRRALGASNADIFTLFLTQGCRQLLIGLSVSMLVSMLVLFLISQYVGIGTATLSVMGLGVVLAVAAIVLVSIYVSLRGVVNREPSRALRYR